jgi:hypothetical protein
LAQEAGEKPNNHAGFRDSYFLAGGLRKQPGNSETAVSDAIFWLRGSP